MSSEEKTEEPTGRKLSKARKEGQVSKSTEISSVFILLIGIVSFYFLALFFYSHFIRLMRYGFSFTLVPEITLSYGLSLFYLYIERFATITAPFAAIVFLAGLIINFAQVGMVISTKPLQPNFSKLNVISGITKLISLNSVTELIKNIIKLIIIGVVFYLAVKGEMKTLPVLYDTSVAYILAYILKISFKIFMYVLLVMIMVAILDFAYQKWQFKKNMMMTKQEIKEEFKQAEGDPLVKSRIKSLQLQAAKKRMMKAVPEADVIVTNPTRLAIALKYDSSKMTAPTVVAKGAGSIAARIRSLASDNNVPIIENKELAQKLYKLVEVGEQVPIELFKAVAELLAYVYRRKGKGI